MIIKIKLYFKKKSPQYSRIKYQAKYRPVGLAPIAAINLGAYSIGTFSSVLKSKSSKILYKKKTKKNPF